MPRIEQTFLIPVVGCLACQLIFRHNATIGFSDRDASHATPKSLPRGRQSCFLDAAGTTTAASSLPGGPSMETRVSRDTQHVKPSYRLNAFPSIYILQHQLRKHADFFQHFN
jgi:hypothetical protein